MQLALGHSWQLSKRTSVGKKIPDTDLSGSIRYYNASATGYSLLRDTLYVPGPENTFTPINIVEPFFDMLGIQ